MLKRIYQQQQQKTRRQTLEIVTVHKYLRTNYTVKSIMAISSGEQLTDFENIQTRNTDLSSFIH